MPFHHRRGPLQLRADADVRRHLLAASLPGLAARPPGRASAPVLSVLRPGGFAFVETINIREREPYEGPFTAAGFREADGWTSQTDCGERGVLFWHGSG